MATRIPQELLFNVTKESVVVADVGTAKKKAKIVRDGFAIEAPVTKAELLDVYLGGLKPTLPTNLPRVLSQSIAPGTLVAPGTVVDIVLTRTDDVVMGVFEGVHADLVQTRLSDVMTAIGQPGIIAVLDEYEAPEDVPDDKRAAVQEAMEGAGADIDEEDPTKGFDKAFNTAKVARAYLA